MPVGPEKKKKEWREAMKKAKKKTKKHFPAPPKRREDRSPSFQNASRQPQQAQHQVVIQEQQRQHYMTEELEKELQTAGVWRNARPTNLRDDDRIDGARKVGNKRAISVLRQTMLTQCQKTDDFRTRGEGTNLTDKDRMEEELRQDAERRNGTRGDRDVRATYSVVRQGDLLKGAVPCQGPQQKRRKKR